jgi:hypothetical protein
MSTQNKTMRFESSSKLAHKAQELQSKESTQNPSDLTTKLASEGGSSEKSPNKGIFVLFLLTNLFVNYDTGVIPASLVEIEKELHVDYTEEAALGIVNYFISHKT